MSRVLLQSTVTGLAVFVSPRRPGYRWHQLTAEEGPLGNHPAHSVAAHEDLNMKKFVTVAPYPKRSH